MKGIVSVIAATMLTISVAACGKVGSKAEKKDTFIQPYTEHIPRADEGKKGERHFDIKSAKPSHQQPTK